MGSIYFGETHSLVEFIKKVFRRMNLDFEQLIDQLVEDEIQYVKWELNNK
jgi:hypothetical protein